MKRFAFTIIEILVVVSIVVILSGMVWNVISKQNQVIVIDGCQYIRYYNGHEGFVITHKGDCTNSIHNK